MLQVKDIVVGGYYKHRKDVYHVLDIELGTLTQYGEKQDMVRFQAYNQKGVQVGEERRCYLGAFGGVMESRVQPRRN